MSPTKKEPKIIIAWPHSEDNVRFGRALKKMGVIDGVKVSDDGAEVLLYSYLDRIIITKQVEREKFEMALGFVPDEELLEEIWATTYRDVRRGKVVEYTDTRCVIVSQSRRL